MLACDGESNGEKRRVRVGGGDEYLTAILCRPEARNAIDLATVEELHAICGAAWRLAELVGRSAAKQVLLGGYRLDAEAALRLGLVAEVLRPGELLPRAEALGQRICRQSALALRLTKLVVDARDAHPLADDLAQPVLFESEDKHARMTAFLGGRDDVTAVGVVGGGRMGAGIAQVFASAGYAVTVAEPDEAAGAAALERIEAGLQRAAAKRNESDFLTAVRARLRVVDAIDALDPASLLVVEAVPEIASVKEAVLAAVEKVVDRRAVIATNTSSLSLNELARCVQAPERFLGMHFFNPVPASVLVEVVTADTTDAATVERAVAWVRELGKSEIVVHDSPGFATTRLGVLLGLEAMRMLEEGVADAESIDRAMELGYKHPMGPLRSTDLIGLDVRILIAEYLESRLGERFRPPDLLRAKVANGELGRKSGRGFYDWE